MFQILTGATIDANELFASLVASFPQFVVILTALVTSLKNLKGTVREFPVKLDKFKTDVNNEFVAFKKELSAVIEHKMGMITDHTLNKIDAFESKLSSFVDNFENKLERLITDNTKLAKENQTYQKVMSIMLTGKPEMIKSEIISLVAKELNLSQEELTRLPSDIIASLPQFKDEFIETKKLLGEAFEEIMRELGYERKEA